MAASVFSFSGMLLRASSQEEFSGKFPLTRLDFFDLLSNLSCLFFTVNDKATQ